MYEYDLFEKFPDGSSLWRACVTGRKNARVFLGHLAKQSKHQFYAINVKTAEILPLKLTRDAGDFIAPAMMERGAPRSRRVVA